jgi:hypothetical protein
MHIKKYLIKELATLYYCVVPLLYLQADLEILYTDSPSGLANGKKVSAGKFHNFTGCESAVVMPKNVPYIDVQPNTPCSLAWLVADM